MTLSSFSGNAVENNVDIHIQLQCLYKTCIYCFCSCNILSILLMTKKGLGVHMVSVAADQYSICSVSLLVSSALVDFHVAY